MNKLLKNAFVPVELIKKEVNIIDLETGKKSKVYVYVKPLSYASAVQSLAGIGDDQNTAVAKRIAYSIRNEDGSPLLTVEQITGENDTNTALSTDLTLELLRVIGEVAELGKKRA